MNKIEKTDLLQKFSIYQQDILGTRGFFSHAESSMKSLWHPGNE